MVAENKIICGVFLYGLAGEGNFAILKAGNAVFRAGNLSGNAESQDPY